VNAAQQAIVTRENSGVSAVEEPKVIEDEEYVPGESTITGRPRKKAP
jgi:hypothetical protein